MKLNIKISHLVAMLAMVAVVLSLANLGITLFVIKSNDDAVQRVYAAKDVTADILPPPMYLIEMRLALSRAVDGTLSADELTDNINRLSTEYETRVDYWTAHPPYGLETQLLGAQHAAGRQFIQAAREVAKMAHNNDPIALLAAVKRAHALYQAHRQGVDVTVDTSVKFAENAMTDAENKTANAEKICVALALFSLALIPLLSKWIMARILKPVNEAVAVTERIVQGNFIQKINTHYTGEMGVLLKAMDKMQASLTHLVSQTRKATGKIQSVATEMATGNVDLSQRTEHSAANLQETAASMAQLNSTVKSNADSARQANQMAVSASDIALNGGQVVEEVVNAMNNIRTSSQQINEITGVIDSIAFQTNILALNAAVEAARAGENGRGFAVVATEVRTLAQRSAEAAKEIKNLISASVQTVEVGSRLVGNAGNTMQEVVKSVQSVCDMLGEITASATDQINGINQVNVSVNKLDHATQQNAALVEQSAAAAESLKDHAQRLSALVAVFQIKEESTMAL